MDKQSDTKGPCLHCDLIEVSQRHMTQHHLTANEAAYKHVEALADLIACADTRDARRQFIRECERLLPRMVRDKVADRLRLGLPFFENVRMH